jgi:SsrA-binding protein
MKIITQNKKAFFDYEILEKLEAGIVLTGDEVKSLRAGHANLTGSFATIHQGELNLLNLHITAYSHAYTKGDEHNRRTRKLLLHKREILRIMGDISRRGITVVPLKLYFNNKGKVKVELGIAKHKKAHTQKADIKEKDIARQTRRELKNIYKY